MGGNKNTNGLLQTLVHQIGELAGSAATKSDLESIRTDVREMADNVRTDVGTLYTKIDGIRADFNGQVAKCIAKRVEITDQVDALQKRADKANSTKGEVKKRKADFRSKVYLAVIVFVLTMLASVAMGLLQKHGILGASP